MNDACSSRKMTLSRLIPLIQYAERAAHHTCVKFVFFFFFILLPPLSYDYNPAANIGGIARRKGMVTADNAIKRAVELLLLSPQTEEDILRCLKAVQLHMRAHKGGEWNQVDPPAEEVNLVDAVEAVADVLVEVQQAAEQAVEAEAVANIPDY
jgi:hypothetical protein